MRRPTALSVMTSKPNRNDADRTARILRELQRPEAYPHAVEDVAVVQTHISQLFFAGDRVYKVKKPVDLDFLDFTTLERRRHFCEEEVRLNRRLAPDTYLGVTPIVEDADGHLHVGGSGDAVEWAVEMERLPERGMLANLLDRGAIDNQKIHAVASRLADFHASCATGPGVDEHGMPDAIRAHAEQNFEQLRAFTGAVDAPPASADHMLSPLQHAFLESRTREFLDAHGELLARRVRDGRIREGHGDLHAENLCFLDDRVVAYDCIEFARGFRCGDVASDLAFLAMDLDCRGYPGFAGYLLKRYAELAGDAELAKLIPFYKGYRAVVRGKVAALTAADPALTDDEREDQRGKAMRYLQLATAYELPPAMILMCGLPASGKSWLAKRLAGSFCAAVLHSDVRRKLLAGIAPTTSARGEYETGLYTPDAKERTYRSLLADAIRGLRAGHAVIVDATFSRRQFRAPFLDAATRLEIPYFLVHVTADDRIIRERLARRENETREVSDADLGVYLREREAFEPPTEVPQPHVLEVSSGEGVPEEQSSVVLDQMIVRRGYA